MRSIVGLLVLAACGQGLRDDRFPTGSSTLASSRRHDATYAVNVDEGSVTRVEGARTVEQEVGASPTRIARVGDELWVTLRGQGGVAVVVDSDGKMKVDEVIPTGVEPVGIVASEDGRRVYVANSLSDTVTELDGSSREVRRTFPVGDHPTWLALTPNGRALFVGSALRGTLSRVDLRDGSVRALELPRGTRETVDGTVDLDPRLSGDPAVSADGTGLAVPAVYADTTSSVDDPENPEAPDVVDGYGSGGAGVGVSRVNPVLVVYELDGAGEPTGPASGVLVAMQPIPGEEERPAVATLRSYPTSVTGSPSSNEWVVTLESSNAVVVVSRRGVDRADDDAPRPDVGFTATDTDCSGECGPRVPFTSAEMAGFVTWPSVAVLTSPGPKAVLFDEQEHAVVHGWLGRTLEALDYDEVDASLEAISRDRFGVSLLTVRGAVTLAASALPADVEAGRALFFSAVDTRMAADGAGVSCSTCHMDGRNDGFTWTLRGEERNTPSLAGPVQQTAPVTWSEEVGSVGEEAQLTSTLRMGGRGLSAQAAAQIEAYVNFTPYPAARRAPGADEVVEGRAIFFREDVGCGSCHTGDLYTDTSLHAIRGPVPTQTPTLRGIGASAPYYHDGSAPTLAAVVATAKDNAMGDTTMLSAAEKRALVAFLESL